MTEQLKNAIRREHPLVDTFISWGEGRCETADVEIATLALDKRIASEIGQSENWPFFAVPPFMRSGWRLGLFDLQAPKQELFLAVKSLICVGFDIRDQASLFRMDFLITLLRQGLISKAEDPIFYLNRPTVNHSVRFIEEITRHGRWLRRAVEGELGPSFRDFLDKLDTAGI